MKKDSEICILAVKAVPGHAGKMFKLADEIRRGKGGEAIHDMRVAGRRLRAALNLFAYCFAKKNVDRWLEEIKGVIKSLAKARDMDVQILEVRRFLKTQRNANTRAGMERLLWRLKQKRKKADEKLVKAVTKFAKSTTCNKLLRVGDGASQSIRKKKYGKAMCPIASKAINERLTEFLTYAGNVNDRSNTDRLHAMRIEAKKLRYTMELTGQLYEGCLDKYINAAKKIQTMLGNMHDYVVWIEFLPRFIEKERHLSMEYCGTEAGLADIKHGVEKFGRYCEQQRDSHYEKFMRLWKRFEKNGLWKELSEVIA